MSDLPPPPPEFEPESSLPPPPDPQSQSQKTFTGWATTGTGQRVELAGVGRRWLARVIDGVIFATLATFGDLNVDSWEVWDRPVGYSLVITALVLVYEVWMIAAKGQTLGKMATRIKVIRTDNGEVPGMSRSFIRWLLPGIFIVAGMFIWVFEFIAAVIYLYLLWDRNRQGLHDKAAGTLVVKA